MPSLQSTPPSPPPDSSDVPGEERAVVDGVTFRRGAKVLLKPRPGGDPYDGLLRGQTATIERIYLDLEDRIYLAVTVDGDPGQELMRETGRFLFFFPGEVELAGP